MTNKSVAQKMLLIEVYDQCPFRVYAQDMRFRPACSHPDRRERMLISDPCNLLFDCPLPDAPNAVVEGKVNDLPLLTKGG